MRGLLLHARTGYRCTSTFSLRVLQYSTLGESERASFLPQFFLRYHTNFDIRNSAIPDFTGGRSSGYFDIVRYLISKACCNPSKKNNNGTVPLHIACLHGHLTITQYLIREAHCSPSCESNDGNTPLHFACVKNQINIVQYLLSTGNVNPLAKNKSGLRDSSGQACQYLQ